MRLNRLMTCAAFLITATASITAEATITLNSVYQDYTVSAQKDSDSLGVQGGDGNHNLPLVNYNSSATDGPAKSIAVQTITGYVGPTATGQGFTAFLLQDSASTSTNGTAPQNSAETRLQINFTLDFAENYSFTRTTNKASNVQLLYQGVSSTSPIDTGTGILGSGTYIMQLDSLLSNDSFDLRVNLDALPEPTALSFGVIAVMLGARRGRRHAR